MRSEDLRGLFYIVKGNYKDRGEKVECEDGVARYIGGYDPNDEDTEEWYRVLDTETYFCSYAGGDYEKALSVIYNQIVKFKSRKKYFQWVSEVSSEDYYFIHYKGASPFSRDQHMKRCEGRVPRVSKAGKALEKEVYMRWGHIYDGDVLMIEDKAYNKVEEKENINSKKKIKLKNKVKVENLSKPVIPTNKKPKKKGVIKKKIKLV